MPGKKPIFRADHVGSLLRPQIIKDARKACLEDGSISTETLYLRKGIENLHFHDLRHETTSRLFETGLNPVEVTTITGQKDTKMLMRYTHLRTEVLVGRLG